MAEHRRLRGGAFAVVGDVLGQMPVEIPLGKRRVVPRQRGQHLIRVARRRLVGLPERFRAFSGGGVRLAHPHRADVLLRVRRRRVHPDAQPVLHEIPVLVIAPQLAPGLAVGHHGAPAGPAHLGVEVPRLLRREPLALQPARGDQQMRVPVRPLGLDSRPHAAGARRAARRGPWRRSAARRTTAPARCGPRRSVPHSPAAPARSRGRPARPCASPPPPPHSTAPRCRRTARSAPVGQQHLMVLGRVAVPEVEQLAGAVGRDGGALVVRGRAHGAAAGAAGDVARAGELDGHAGTLIDCWAASQLALPCNAYCVCTLPLHFVPLVQNPLRGVIARETYRSRNRALCGLARARRYTYRRRHANNANCQSTHDGISAIAHRHAMSPRRMTARGHHPPI